MTNSRVERTAISRRVRANLSIRAFSTVAITQKCYLTNCSSRHGFCRISFNFVQHMSPFCFCQMRTLFGYKFSLDSSNKSSLLHLQARIVRKNELITTHPNKTTIILLQSQCNFFMLLDNRRK